MLLSHREVDVMKVCESCRYYSILSWCYKKEKDIPIPTKCKCNEYEEVHECDRCYWYSNICGYYRCALFGSIDRRAYRAGCFCFREIRL